MVALWNDDARLVLIDEIRKRPEMWDSRRERYASTDRKKEIYNEIAEIINASGACSSQMFTEDDVRNQWKNLKDTFKRKLKKRQADMEAGIEDVEPTWRFWSKMLFIRHDCHHDPSTASMSNLNVEAACANFESYMHSLHSLVDKPMAEERNNIIDDNNGINNGMNNGPTAEVRMAPQQPMQNGYQCDNRDMQPNSSVHCPEEVDSLPSQSPLHQSTTSVARIKRRGVKRKALEAEGEAGACNPQAKPDFEDEYTWFGRSVASSLRRLAECAPIASLTLKKQISDLMFDTELKQLLRSQKIDP